ncbi:MAG: 3-deoxy-8-phosphooctulonate synthase [Opitutales bacterium]
MLHDPQRFLAIAGPCALENEAVVIHVARELARLRIAHPQWQVCFKGSYDKANRTALSSSRGPGLERGLELLAQAREISGCLVVTDIHLPEQATPAGEVCDILQIPAFLCRQTDLLYAAAATGRVVKVKKGQFLSPGEMRFVVEKLQGAGASEIWLTERGSSFGYQNLVVDCRSFPMMGRWARPVVFDATHSVQLPGGADGASGGQREFVPTLARAAVAAGADGVFLETHPEPETAISDSACQWPLDQLEPLLAEVAAIWQARRLPDIA